MSFSVSKSKQPSQQELSTPIIHPPTIQSGTDLYITDYSAKSFVVMGDTLSHSGALTTLGGTFNPNLKIGNGWIFAKIRKQSVENYIDTGDIVPYVYTNQDKSKYNTPAPNAQLRAIFKEFRYAFNADEQYEGISIINVIYQLEEKYSVEHPQQDQQDPEMDSEPSGHKRLAKKLMIRKID